MFRSNLLTSKVLLNSIKEEKKLDLEDEKLLNGKEHGCLLDSEFWIFLIVFLLKTSQEIQVLSHCLKRVVFCFQVN